MTQKMAQSQSPQILKKSRQDIQQHLRQAMATLRLLQLSARDRPLTIKSSWGDFQQIAALSSAQYRMPIKRKATPQDISHMDFWLTAMANLPEGQRRIVMARACSIPWRRLEEMDGRSHTTLRKVEADALNYLGASFGEYKRLNKAF